MPHGIDLDNEEARLLNIPELLKQLTAQRELSLAYVDERQRILSAFFRSHSSSDIAIILYGGLKSSLQLAPYLHGRNLMMFRPKTSYRHKNIVPFLRGQPNPANDLLLFDEDAYSGASLRETINFFQQSGYQLPRMWAYLDL